MKKLETIQNIIDYIKNIDEQGLDINDELAREHDEALSNIVVALEDILDRQLEEIKD